MEIFRGGRRELAYVAGVMEDKTGRGGKDGLVWGEGVGKMRSLGAKKIGQSGNLPRIDTPASRGTRKSS